MGFGVSGSHTVMFIAAIVVAVGVVATMQTSVTRLSGGMDARGDALTRELTTDIRIVNDPGDMPDNPLVLYVLNTGTSSLEPTETIVLVDGAVRTDLAFDVLDTTDETLRAGQVLKVTVNNEDLASGDHRVKVIVEHGVSDTLRFNIP